MTAKLNVVIRKLSELTIIKTHLLLLGSHAQAETGDKVHQEQDDTGQNKGVGETGNTVGKLVSELNVVLVEPAAIDLAETIEVCDVVTRIIYQYKSKVFGFIYKNGYSRSEETGQQVANNTTNGVLSKDIEAFVNVDPELDLGGQIASNSSDNTKDHSSPCGNETGGGRDCNKSLHNQG